jgi:rare lipoprotein A
MNIFRFHRRAATSVVMLAIAGLMPAPVFADVSAKGGVPGELSVQVEQEIAPIPETVAAPEAVEEKALPAPTEEKVLPQPEVRSTLLGEGVASYYGAELAGNRTASGERFNPNALTAAHRTLPLGTRLRVTNKANGKSVIVRVNDRGPFAKGRILDLSRAAAERISMVRSGTARISIARAD